MARSRAKSGWKGQLRSDQDIAASDDKIVTITLSQPYAITLSQPYAPLPESFLPPFSPGHILGTDNFGRDIWSRIAYRTRLDLQIGLLSVLFPFIFGGLIGIATGYLGGKLDTIVMRVVNVLMGRAGGPHDRLLVRTHHASPHPAERDRAGTDLRFTGMVLAILTGATLSFLGLSPQPPTPEWGAMIAEGRQYLLLAWWMTTLPGLALLVVGVGLSLIGDGLAERRGG